jgi:predicted RNA polymerase sigma factor
VVVAALATDADQPSLHAVLGDLYARTGLPREADEAYEQARALASPAAR